MSTGRTFTDWKSRGVSAADTIAAVASGHTVFVHGACATPAPLIDALCARRDLEKVKLYHLHTAGAAPFAERGREKEFRSVSLFTGAPLRQAIAEDRADFVPIFLSDIPGLFLSGAVKLAVMTPEVTAMLVAQAQAFEATNNAAYGHGSFLQAAAEHAREFAYFYGTRWTLWGSR